MEGVPWPVFVVRTCLVLQLANFDMYIDLATSTCYYYYLIFSVSVDGSFFF